MNENGLISKFRDGAGDIYNAVIDEICNFQSRSNFEEQERESLHYKVNVKIK